jgi:uncharacterized protein (TIGR03437 family)
MGVSLRAKRWILVLALATGAPSLPAGVNYTIETVAGSNAAGDGGPAVAAPLGSAEGIALDSAGNLYIADAAASRVRKIHLGSGVISTVAGIGTPGFTGDGGPAAEAQLNTPYDVAVDSKGNVYIADLGNGRVRKVSAKGTIETLAGSPAPMVAPRNLVVDAADNVYVTDFGAHRIYRFASDGKFSIVAGTGEAGYNGDGFANTCALNAPAGLAVDSKGVLYFADSQNHLIRNLTLGIVTTIVKDPQVRWPTGIAIDQNPGIYMSSSADGSGGVFLQQGLGAVSSMPALLSLKKPRDLALDAAGRLYIADGHHVWRLDSAGGLKVIAGSGNSENESQLLGPIGVSTDDAGNVYIAEESRRRIRKLDAGGRLTTLVGSGLSDPVSVAVNHRGDLWIADYSGNSVYRAQPDAKLVLAAGTGEAGFSEGDGSALKAKLNRPRGVALDLNGNVFIADSLNHRVRKLSPAGTITTIAGTGAPGYSGDGGLPDRARLHAPAGIAVDLDGNVYIAEQGNHVIRKVGVDGFIYTVAGTGAMGSGGDGGPATSAGLRSPAGIAIDSDGNLLIADTGNHRVRLVDAMGQIRTIAGTGAPGFGGDLGSAELAQLHSPASIAVDTSGNIFVADLENGLIRRLTPAVAPPPVDLPDGCKMLHGASFRSGPFAAGQVVTIFGTGLAGTQVRVGNAPAHVFYAGATQVNAQLPYGLAHPAELQVLRDGKPHCGIKFDVAPAAPGVFAGQGGSGQAAAVNENGSLNSKENPAPRGSVVTFYATGEGTTEPQAATGTPAVAPFARPVLPVHVRIGGLPADVLYAGAAPGFIGLMQVNVRVPGGFAPSGVLSVELSVGSASSQPGITIAVR